MSHQTQAPILEESPASPKPAALNVPAAQSSPQHARFLSFGSDRWWVLALLVFFATKQVFFVFAFGPFTGHDEVDHFYYVRRLAEGQGLGVVGEVLLPEEAAPFAEYVADYPLNSEVIQPPLYHALLAGLSVVLPDDTLTQLYAMRMVAVALGALVVLLAYATARFLFPTDLVLRAGVPLFIAFQPQFSFEAAIVNHDILVIFLASLVVYLCLRGIKDGFSPALSLTIGLVSAAGLWTKVNFGLVVPVVALSLVIWAWDLMRRSGVSLRRGGVLLLQQGVTAIVLPLIAISPWFARNLELYGDLTGTARLQDVSDYGLGASTYYEMLTSPLFWQGLFEDFWGNYGWRHIPWDPEDYRIVAAAWGLMGIGALAVLVREVLARTLGTGSCVLDGLQFRGLVVAVATIVMFGFGVLYVGTVQFTQARFAFPAMISFAVVSLLGLAAWLPIRYRPAGLVTLTIALLALTIWVTVRYVLPYYYGPGGGALLVPEG